MAESLTKPATEAMDDHGQGRIVRFLSDSNTHQGVPVEHMETHVSHVFLAGPYAYKMKKAVRLPFVDFSTLALRRLACFREIEVNSRTAEDIYLDVVAVHEDGGTLRLGPPGEPVEYVVRMHRFGQEDLFDRMATGNRLTPTLMRGVADAAADLHLMAARQAGNPLSEDFETTATDLLARLKAASDDAETRAVVDAVFTAVTCACQRDLPKIRARARHGAVRHCHGDLHLRNICLFNGKVRLFDAIEFEPKYSHIDVLYDIGFAAMDLLHRGHNADAILMLSRYLSATRDYAGLDVLRLFMAVRAGIRALVALLGSGPDKLAEAQSYLTLALDILWRPARPHLIGIGGRSGTGKSSLAMALAPQLARVPDIVVIRADETRKRLLGVVPEAHLPAEAYATAMGERVYRRMFRDAARALRAGAAVILDASFLSTAHRKTFDDLGQRLAVPTKGLWLTAPTETLEHRLDWRTGDASDADAAVMRRQTDPAETGTWHRLSAARTIDDLVRDALPITTRMCPD